MKSKATENDKLYSSKLWLEPFSFHHSISIQDQLFDLHTGFQTRLAAMREEEDDDPLSLLLPQQHQQDPNLIQYTCLESKKLWQVAAPSIFSRLAMFSVTVDTQSFAGHLSDLGLAAISISTTVIIAITFGSMLGMASALETRCGQAYGPKQYHMLGIYLQRSWVVLFLCSLLCLPLFVFASPLLKLMGQPEDVAEQTGLVCVWLIPFHLSFPFQMTLQRFLQCQQKTGGVCLGLWRGFGDPCVCELGFCV